MTEKQLFAWAYKQARLAGLDTDTSDAVARKFLERLGSNQADAIWARDEILARVIQQHAAP